MNAPRRHSHAGRPKGSSRYALTHRAFFAFLVLCSSLLILAVSASAAPPEAFCPGGQGAGQCGNPQGLALNQSTGDVYVTDGNNRRVSQFTANGAFVRALGFGVATGAAELQTCASSCQEGIPGSGQGQFSYSLFSVAVDNDPLSTSHGDLYVVDTGNSRIEKFTTSGEFLLMFGKGVNKTAVTEGRPATEQNVCPAPGHPADTCGAGVEGNGPGQLGNFRGPVAIDSSGEVWYGDVNRLEHFSPAGGFLSEVSLPGAGAISALAVDAAGDFYALATELPGVRKYDSSGALVETLDESGHPEALGLDPVTGDLYVADQEASVTTIVTYDPSGTQTGAFGSGEVIGNPTGNAVIFGDSAQRLYLASGGIEKNAAVQSFTLPEPGPLPGSGTSKATQVRKTTATLNSEVNPQGAATTYHFQYVDQHSFETEGGFASVNTQATPESASIGADFKAHPAAAPVTGLTPNTAYRFRVVASNECEPVANPGHQCVVSGETTEFTTLPPAAIDATFATEVSSGSATLNAEVNPLGDSTSYRFEYTTEAHFIAEGFTGATRVPLPDAPLGGAEADVSVAQPLQGLLAATTYRYRVLITNALAPAGFSGPTLSFTTQGPAALTLPDVRQWELVSQPDKHGAKIEPIGQEGLIQVSADGDSLTYHTNAPTEPAPPGYSNQVQIIAGHGSTGWQNLNVSLPHQGATGKSEGVGEDYRFFSEDLTRAVVQPAGAFIPSSSPFALAPAEASEQTAFLRSNFPSGDPTALCTTSCYRPLVSGVPGFANVSPGTQFGEEGQCPAVAANCGPIFEGATRNLEHVALVADAQLTAIPVSGASPRTGLYEWSAGALRLVSILPPSQGGTGVAGDLGSRGGIATGAALARNAISADGSRVIWSTSGSSEKHLYLRYNTDREESAVSGGECTEPTKACTLQLDQVQSGSGSGEAMPIFQTASTDASRIFFTDRQRLTADAGASSSKPDLYECRIVAGACQLADLTPLTSGQPAFAQGIIGASEDGSWSYFVANAALTSGEGAIVNGSCEGNFVSPPGSTCNLYVRHSGTTKLVAVLSGADQPDWTSNHLPGLTARVSPDGRWLAFVSQRPLTGYDNRDAISGQPDEEVYLYDAAANNGQGQLSCASCNPTGARPHGIEFFGTGGGSSIPLAGTNGAWKATDWLAATLPVWTAYQGCCSLYQSRYLSDSGRLFFNAHDALVPADSNGAGDVYEYEPQGVGDCAEASPRYAPTNGGCLSLISSGTSKEESAFLDASQSGDDVFFLTLSQLSTRDIDGALDIYDARSRGGEPQAVKPVECVGDACQQPAVPPNDATPGSLTFNGAGNLHQAKPKKSKKHKKKAHRKSHKRPANHNRGGAR